MHTFLPNKPPLKNYISSNRSLKTISKIASELPKLLLTNSVQSTINSLHKNSLSINFLLKNKKNKEIKLAMSHLSFISHAYICLLYTSDAADDP